MSTASNDPGVCSRPPHYAVRWPVALGNEVEPRGRIVSISASGLMFVSPTPYALQERLRLTTESADLPCMTFGVKIIRQRSAAEGWYAYGAHIVEMTSAHQEVLTRVLEALERLRAERSQAAKRRHSLKEREKLQLPRTISPSD